MDAPHSMRSLVSMAAVSLLFLSGRPARVDAQVVRGSITDAAVQQPLGGVSVALLDSAGFVVATTESDRSGRFRVRARHRGVHMLRASVIGYEAAHSAPFRIGPDTVTVNLALVAAPISIDPVEVRSAARIPRLAAAGFYERQAKGYGSFVTREQIDQASPQLITDVLRSIPGVRVVNAGPDGSSFDIIMRGAATTFFRGATQDGSVGTSQNRMCFPSIAIDGVVVRRGGQSGEVGGWVHFVPPSDVEAVEVYPGGAGLPPQLRGNTSPCGSVLIWTRREK
jgi:hypothetical protein